MFTVISSVNFILSRHKIILYFGIVRFVFPGIHKYFVLRQPTWSVFQTWQSSCLVNGQSLHNKNNKFWNETVLWPNIFFLEHFVYSEFRIRYYFHGHSLFRNSRFCRCNKILHCENISFIILYKYPSNLNRYLI